MEKTTNEHFNSDFNLKVIKCKNIMFASDCITITKVNYKKIIVYKFNHECLVAIRACVCSILQIVFKC